MSRRWDNEDAKVSKATSMRHAVEVTQETDCLVEQVEEDHDSPIKTAPL